jgi:hypothetical protein
MGTVDNIQFKKPFTITYSSTGHPRTPVKNGPSIHFLGSGKKNDTTYHIRHADQKNKDFTVIDQYNLSDKYVTRYRKNNTTGETSVWLEHDGKFVHQKIFNKDGQRIFIRTK